MLKKTMIVLMIILLSFQVHSLSLLGAQDISKKYLSEGDLVDSFNQSKISCDNQEYFVIPIINSLGEPVMFTPISVSSSQVYLSKTDSFNVKLIKTGYLIKILKNSDSGNYLSLQLIDSFDSQINSLYSKKAQLNGVLQKNYSGEVDAQVTTVLNNLEVLISYLEELKENLSSLLSAQNKFLSSPNCDDTSNLLKLFESSFKRYNEISGASLTYIQASQELVTKMVADDDIPSQELSGIVNIASPPQGLNSNISLIFERLSSTSAFYTKISNDLKGSSGTAKINLYVDNLSLRKDQVDFKDVFERYDSSFPNFNNLESVVKYILNTENKSYWKEQSEVIAIQKIYEDIQDFSSKAQYSKAMPLITTLKSKSSKVIDSGFVEYEEEVNWFYYVFIGFIVLMLIVFLIIIKRKKTQKSKKYKNKPVNKKNSDDLFNFDDPFN